MPQERSKASSTRSRRRLSQAYLPIEDFAVIGNLHTVALVGKNGSIDWCCIPRFDAPSVFGALLDAEKGGFFCIAPPDTPGMERKQLYLPDTNCIASPKSSSAGSFSPFSPRLLLALAPGQKRADHLWPNHSSTAILTTKGRES